MSRSIVRAGRHLLAGVVLFLVCVALIIHDLSGANRPHELKLVPLVTGLSVVNAILCTRTLILLVALWRARESDPLRAYQYLLFPLGVAYAGVSLLLLVTSVATLVG